MIRIDDGVPLLRNAWFLLPDSDIGEGDQLAVSIDGARCQTSPSRMEGIVFLLAPARRIPHFGLPREVTARRVRGHTTHELRDAFDEVVGSSVNPGDDLVALSRPSILVSTRLSSSLSSTIVRSSSRRSRESTLLAPNARENAQPGDSSLTGEPAVHTALVRSSLRMKSRISVANAVPMP
jgi:hypothetical protein